MARSILCTLINWEIYDICAIPPERDMGRDTVLEKKNRVTIDQLLVLLPDLIKLNDISRSTFYEDEGNGILAFTHFSVREYLTGSQLLDIPSAHSTAQLRDAHRLVARECIAYLHISQKMGSEAALKRYALQYWQSHAIAAGECDEAIWLDDLTLSASTNDKSLKCIPHLAQWAAEDPEIIGGLVTILRRGVEDLALFSDDWGSMYSGHSHDNNEPWWYEMPGLDAVESLSDTSYPELSIRDVTILRDAHRQTMDREGISGPPLYQQNYDFDEF